MKRVASLLLTLALCVGLVLPAGAAGTIFGLPLSQQFDNNGKPLIGAKLYIYEANTTTPVTVYEDFGLTSELPWPLEADAAGRLPEFWLDDGDYRARLTTAGGVEQFDIQSITALGPSSGGGGGGGTVPDSQIATTGDLKWRLGDGTISAWVRLNGRTIGSVSSGATERANADTQPLYEYIYAICDDSKCPVTGGRGSSAVADFEANKPIKLPDMRGRGLVAFDDMGNTAAGVLAGATIPFTVGGQSERSLTLSQMPSHQHSFSGSTSTAGNHQHQLVTANSFSAAGSGGPQIYWVAQGTGFTEPAGAHSHTFSGVTNPQGSGAAFSLMDPYMPATIYIKL